MAHRRACTAGLAAGAVLLLAGCGGNEDTISPAGRPERSITKLFWVMFGVSCVGFGVIVLLLFLGWARRSKPTLPFGGGERAATTVVLGLGIALPVALLVALFIWSDIFVLKSTAAPAKGTTAMTVRVIGHQWWWEVRYHGSRAVTANEIHIPVAHARQRRPHDRRRDPQLLDPGAEPEGRHDPRPPQPTVLDADRPGVYRGQCSEFCGLQHAHMSVEVVAQPKAEFARGSRGTPGLPRARAPVFQQSCASCHTIRGTSAEGSIGPDLTHFGSRTTLAALTLAEHPGVPRCVARGSTAREAREPDARLST